MKTFAKFATAAAVAGALALSMATPSFAATYHHQSWSHSSRNTAAATNGYADQASGYADPGYGSYAYAPRAVSGSTVNEQQCTMSPGSQNYEPCFNY
jgi:hypothetical protein